MNIKSLIHMILLRRLQIVLFVIYMSIWISFGFYYRYKADASHGTDFLFQEDLASEARYNAFCNKVGFIVPYSIVRRLDNEISRRFIKMVGQRTYTYYNVIKNNQQTLAYIRTSPYAMFADDKPIGDNWRDYYMLKIMRCKPLLFTLDKLPIIKVRINNNSNTLHHFTPFHIELYKIVHTTSGSKVEQINTCGSYTVYFDFNTLAKYKWYNAHFKYYSFWYLPQLLSDSLLFPNNDIRKLLVCNSGHFTYPIADFLYFSAVTLTTLGYGDILPNDTTIRIAVMIETFMGLFLIGCFISSFFINKPK